MLLISSLLVEEPWMGAQVSETMVRSEPRPPAPQPPTRPFSPRLPVNTVQLPLCIRVGRVHTFALSWMESAGELLTRPAWEPLGNRVVNLRF